MTDVIHSDKKEVQETPAPTSPIGDLTATDDAPHLPSYDPHSEKPGIFQTLHFSENKSAVIVEFIGTFLFTLTIPLAGINDNETAPIAIGFMYMALVFSFAYLSGAHMNPAISSPLSFPSGSLFYTPLPRWVVASRPPSIAL